LFLIQGTKGRSLILTWKSSQYFDNLLRRTKMSTKRVLTGMRTTGQLHLGHYAGALKLWLDAQESKKYECFFLLADVQALTTHANKPEVLEESVKETVLDWLSVGLDPSLSRVNFVLQSQVTERAELSVLLSMVARYKEVLRNPTLKDESIALKDPSLGFINYPVDQVADILMISSYPPKKGDEILVPVGNDQVPHLEYARTLARRFNQMYKKEVFIPCKPLVGEVGRLVGIDGHSKMSKSKGNTINLTDDAETVTKKVGRMFTDPNRIHADTPGETEKNPVFVYLRAFHPNQDKVEEMAALYRKGKIGDVAVKKELAEALNDFLEPIRERRAKYKDEDIRKILELGTKVAQEICKPVVEAAREAMHLVYPR